MFDVAVFTTCFYLWSWAANSWNIGQPNLWAFALGWTFTKVVLVRYQ